MRSGNPDSHGMYPELEMPPLCCYTFTTNGPYYLSIWRFFPINSSFSLTSMVSKMYFLFPRQCIMCHCCETKIGQLKFRNINIHYTFGLPLVTSQIIEICIYKNYSYWLYLHQSWQSISVLSITLPETFLRVLSMKGFVLIFQAISLDMIIPM